MRLRRGGARDSVTKTWIIQYRNAEKKSCRVTLDKTVDKMNLREARKAAADELNRILNGADPRAERDAAAKNAIHTLGTESQKYLDGLKSGRIGVGRNNQPMRPRSYAEVARHLKTHWASLASEPLSKIGRLHIVDRLTEIQNESGPVARNRARSSLSAFYVWAIREGLADANPVILTNKAGEKPRERVLTDAEIVAIWNACSEDDHGRIVRLLILTGQRREEAAGIRESEIERDRRVWHLPGTRTKNGVPNDVPLSDAGLASLPAKNSRGPRDLLFGEGTGPFSGWSRCKERLDKRSGVSGWTLHDLRRTAATGMADIGVQPHIIEAVLNHSSGARRGVAGIYNRAQYAAEKRDALDRWAKHVQGLVAGETSNVVALARG